MIADENNAQHQARILVELHVSPGFCAIAAKRSRLGLLQETNFSRWSVTGINTRSSNYQRRKIIKSLTITCAMRDVRSKTREKSKFSREPGVGTPALSMAAQRSKHTRGEPKVTELLHTLCSLYSDDTGKPAREHYFYLTRTNTTLSTLQVKLPLFTRMRSPSLRGEVCYVFYYNCWCVC